jgi:hypothetical protein
MDLPKKVLVEDYLLLLPSKALEGDFRLFKKYRFLNMVTSEIFSVLWKYLGQFFFFFRTHFKDILIKKIRKITTTTFDGIFFTRVDLMWNNSIIEILLFFQLSQFVKDYLSLPF